MILIEKKKATILNLNCYFNIDKAIKCDNVELFNIKNMNIIGGYSFELYALRITR